MKNPKVSVIIPAYNAEETIKQCIEGILNQTYKNIEVIVVDDCSTDNTSKIATTLKCKLIKSNKNMGAGNAKNLGLKAAVGDYIYFIDSDCVPEKDCIEWLMNSFSKNKNIGVVGGTCVIPSDYKSIFALAYDVAERFKDVKNLDEIYILYLSGSNLCIKKEVVDIVGFFNEKFITHEDFDFTFRATQSGYKILFQPKAVTYHCHQRKKLKSYLKRTFKGGQYGTIFRLKYKPSLPFSKFYPKNVIIFSIILPLFVTFSILRIIKKNVGARPIKEILITLPVLIIGQILWGLGCVRGAYKFKKEIDFWKE
jgi:GT2 family glycosyltransferase